MAHADDIAASRHARTVKQPDFGPPIGPWSASHTLGAVVVMAIAAGIGLTIWPGWERLAALVA